jgi:hypothetical protein
MPQTYLKTKKVAVSHVVVFKKKEKKRKKAT